MTPPAAVAVLLCTYNGAAHLPEQLASIQGQQFENLTIFASDDGSNDETVPELDRFAGASSVPITIRRGPCAGHAVNFLSLLCDGSISADYYAFADQDDCWDAVKIDRAVELLATTSAGEPALYCGRTRSISDKGDLLGLSPLFARPPSFRNALVHNIGGGNTMVFNAAARELLVRAGVVDVVTHDWWTYLLVSGAGGRVIYDPQPCLSYRQHSANEIGANLSLGDRLQRYTGALGGRNREWNDRNLEALRQNSLLLTRENRMILEEFSRSRRGGVRERICGLRKSGLYAQTLSGNIGLYVATLLKKI